MRFVPQVEKKDGEKVALQNEMDTWVGTLSESTPGICRLRASSKTHPLPLV